MNIVLTGFMGTGKTAVGKRLAKRLGWRFADIDELIEQSARMPIARIFSERGEAVFRRLERRFITRIVHGDQQVIATGGGAVVDPKNRGRLRATGFVICLTATPQAIVARIGRRIAARPMLSGSADPVARIRTLMKQRARAYTQADLTIDTSRLSIEQVAQQVWERLSPCVCRSWQYLVTHGEELARRYAGKYVVVVDDHVVGCGQTQLEAYQNAPAHLTGKRDAGIYYIPIGEESLTAF